MIKIFIRNSGLIFALTITVASLIFYFVNWYFYWTLLVHLSISVASLLTFVFSGGLSRLFRNLFNRKERATNSLYRIVFCLLSVLCFLIIFSIIRNNNKLNFDSTENHVFTLSKQTKELLDKFSSKVRVRYFTRGSNILKTDIDILNRYHQYSNLFSYTRHDLDKERPLSESLNITEINSLHLALEGESSSSVTIAGGLTEEKITNALLKISRTLKPTVFFSTNHGEGEITDTLEGGFSLLRESLNSDGFLTDTINLSSDTDIPVVNSLLVMLCPVRDLTELEYLKVENFLNKGGSLILFSEPRLKINLHKLLENRGIIVGNDTIVGIEKFTTGKSSLGVQPVISNYAKHPALKNFDKSIIVSAAVSVKKKADADNVTEIAFSDQDTWAESNLESLYSKSPIAVKEESDIPGPVPIVAVYSGDGENKQQRIAVIGDLDFVANVNLYQLFNRDFVLNLMNWAVGDEEYISIRAESLRKSKKMISEQEFANIFIWMAVILPEMVLFIGLCNAFGCQRKN